MKNIRSCTLKERILEGFGKRLAQIRKSRGVTQAELGDAVGVSNRVIAYYEQEDAQPPGAILVDLARALRVSADELLNLKPIKHKDSPKTTRLLNRLRQVEKLPSTDQKAVLKFVDALLESRGHAKTNGQRRTSSRRRRKAS